MVFKSIHREINVPTQVSAWDWLFTPISSKSPNVSPQNVRGFVNTATNERLTHHQIKDFSTYLSTALVQKYNLKPGEVVSLCSPNSIWFPVAVFGVMRAGGVAALSSPAYGEDEMVHAFNTVDCKIIFTSSTALDVVVGAAARLGIEKDRILLVDGEKRGFDSIRTLIEFGGGFGDSGQSNASDIPVGKINSEVCALLCFSSGTTGLPKAVMISHHNIIAQCLQLMPTTSDDHKAVLGLLPFYHITGVVKMLVLPFVIGAEVVILPKFTMRGLLETIVKYSIAEVQVVPPIIIRLVNDPIVEQYNLSCIKRFASGAAPISAEVLHLLETKFPQRGFKQGYGMTESCGCITTHPLDKHAFKYARTGGTLVANTEVKIVNAEGKVVGVDEKGEILAKGPQMVMGYFNNPKATAETFDSEGFLRTGDQGSINREGFITIHERIKEMIKVKGVQVAPAELEDLLLGHPKVEDCAVIGIPDAYSGEKPLGFVVLKSETADRETAREDIRQYVKDKKSRPKWLKNVQIVDQIPKSASGKILRRVLKNGYNFVSVTKAKL